MSDLISDEYLEQLRLMRSEQHRPNWGRGGQRHVQVVVGLVDKFKFHSVLDYGCGHGVILEQLAGLRPKLSLQGYDPGIPERAALPEPAELLISTDVLEHIEPDKLDGCLTHIRFLTKKVAYINVHTERANAILPDGRNAHLIQKPAEWWADKLREHYGKVERVPGFESRRPSFLCE